jgi:molecular chaperone IbpA
MYNSLSITTTQNTSNNTLTAGMAGSNSFYSVSSVPAIHYGGTDISKSFIGWDSTIKEIEKLGERMVKNSGNFPPYNVVKVDEDTYLIEFAVAGFTKENVKVSQEKNALIIEGSMDEDEDIEYLHKGIATRSFTRVIALAEHVEVQGAEFKNGILSVTLERILPEEEQPKTIKIK